MKNIKKRKEPASLKAYKDTPGSSYESPQSDWQDQLLQEQGHLCAYCMGRIGRDRKNGEIMMRIEHNQSQEIFPEKGLDWDNMLGVCNGNRGLRSHCDVSKRSLLFNVLNPLFSKKCEDLLTYSTSGKIIGKSKNGTLNAQIKDDLERILNLNDEKLVQLRKDVMDVAKDKLIKEIPIRMWTKKYIDTAIEEWKTRKDDKHKAYCQAAIWFLENLKVNPKYK